ncbi:sulfite exporter TauE/SafE family protein [Alloyangia pacifica]|uniref:Probable membrane transporter protein n=1 Tax=Alloyangia pacifica TaxID=311180 RepID=A0A1I6UV27_9RHOB|nr:sulfite exporter TauE/SafE family protein [Alloyangia pacifica]SDI54276.1 hypothetical protein SAMN04488245_11827 [Alloyangia pacifica]SFT05250.1 hypothetical protein SAMN04488050_10923 [Alloyangia pacifica]
MTPHFFSSILDMSPIEIASLAAAALLAGLARGFAGFGSGMVFIPLAAMVVGPARAAPILLVIDLLGGLPTLRGSWRTAEKPANFVILLGAALGMPLGVTLLLQGDPELLRWCISGAILLTLALVVSGRTYRGRTGPLVYSGVGVLSGVMSGVAQIGGPPVVAFWMGVDRSVAQRRANILFYFVIVSLLAFVVYLGSGLLSLDIAALSVLAGMPFTAGVLAGGRLYRFATPEFVKLSTCILILVAVCLGLPLWDHLR